MKFSKETEALLEDKIGHLSTDEVAKIIEPLQKIADILFDQWLKNKKDAYRRRNSEKL